MRSNNFVSLLLAAILALSVSTSAVTEDAPTPVPLKEGPLPLPTKPLNIHPLTGIWWAQTIYDIDGQPIWKGGTTPDTVVLRVSLTGSIQTAAKCNILNGQFGRADGQSVALMEPKVLFSTRRFCPGEYPPTVRFKRVAAFERTGLQLSLFDSEGRPIATYLDVYGMASELEDLLN